MDTPQLPDIPAFCDICCAYKFEPQRLFASIWQAIPSSDRNAIINERFRHLRSKPSGDEYFQSILSYAYSIASSAALAVEADAFISIRYDAIPIHDVVVNGTPQDGVVLTDAATGTSPLFMGDFILCGNARCLQHLTTLYTWLTRLLTDSNQRIQIQHLVWGEPSDMSYDQL